MTAIYYLICCIQHNRMENIKKFIMIYFEKQFLVLKTWISYDSSTTSKTTTVLWGMTPYGLVDKYKLHTWNVTSVIRVVEHWRRRQRKVLTAINCMLPHSICQRSPTYDLLLGRSQHCPSIVVLLPGLPHLLHHSCCQLYCLFSSYNIILGSPHTSTNIPHVPRPLRRWHIWLQPTAEFNDLYLVSG